MPRNKVKKFFLYVVGTYIGFALIIVLDLGVLTHNSWLKVKLFFGVRNIFFFSGSGNRKFWTPSCRRLHPSELTEETEKREEESGWGWAEERVGKCGDGERESRGGRQRGFHAQPSWQTERRAHTQNLRRRCGDRQHWQHWAVLISNSHEDIAMLYSKLFSAYKCRSKLSTQQKSNLPCTLKLITKARLFYSSSNVFVPNIMVSSQWD